MHGSRTPHGTSQLAIAGLAALAAMLAAVLAALWPTTAAAAPTPDHLAAHGWDCGQTPPFVVPPRIVCAPPGLGRPFPGNPDPRPVYRLKLFTVSGEFLAHVHFIRADLYAGQPCHGGDAYVLSPRIPYYECLNFTG